jgi:predicted Rossmann fold flavoprotein
VSATNYEIAVIGGGAAGLATAIFTRRLNPARSVAVLDGAKKLGAKILVSGGGRCNVTNAVVTEQDFWGGKPTIVRNILRAFAVPQTVALREAARVGVAMLTDHRIDGVLPENHRFTLVNSHGALAAERLVLATGGRSLPKSGSDGTGYDIAQVLGHTIVPTTPALAPLTLNDGELHRQLSGVSHDAELTVWIDARRAIRLRGSLLWTHFGVSGPLVLNASRHWCRATLENRNVRVTLNFSPPSTFDAVDRRLTDLTASRPRASIPTLLATFLPAAVANALVNAVAIDETVAASQLTRTDRRRLVHALVEWTLPIADTRGYNYAEATAGGVELTEIDPSTMASRVCPGLYLVGEVLDVDGRIGGFNFQWAWSSGTVAGRAAAKR